MADPHDAQPRVAARETLAARLTVTAPYTNVTPRFQRRTRVPTIRSKLRTATYKVSKSAAASCDTQVSGCTDFKQPRGSFEPGDDGSARIPEHGGGSWADSNVADVSCPRWPVAYLPTNSRENRFQARVGFYQAGRTLRLERKGLYRFGVSRVCVPVSYPVKVKCRRAWPGVVKAEKYKLCPSWRAPRRFEMSGEGVRAVLVLSRSSLGGVLCVFFTVGPRHGR
jgi:hypothetical protein